MSVEIYEKVCQRFLALVLPHVHDKIIQVKSLEYKQRGREGMYFTVFYSVQVPSSPGR